MSFLSLVGAGFLLYLAFLVIRFVLNYVVLNKPNLSVYGAKTGAWALVTGSSDGIGKGFAEELARAGFNLVLVSRTESKLNELAQQLREQFKVQTKVLAVDVSSASALPKTLEDIHTLVSDIPLTILVNNVGVNTDIPVSLEEHTDEEIDRLVQVNVVFHTKITRALIPHLKKNKRSAIVDLSSITQAFPTSPLLSVYAATKAYIATLSKAVHTELASQNVDVIAVSPAFVASAMSGFKKGSILVTLPNQTALDSLSKLGKYLEVTPSLVHALERLVVNLLPVSIVGPQIYKSMKDTREKLLKRKAK
jgi:17beta-estradiol 17-dehydrogenase / very-long-chain 3-oxoacyl-CoA reductase